MNLILYFVAFCSFYRDDSNPKTIDQIQKEADRESMELNLALNSSQERNKRQDSRNSMDYRKRKHFFKCHPSVVSYE